MSDAANGSGAPATPKLRVKALGNGQFRLSGGALAQITINDEAPDQLSLMPTGRMADVTVAPGSKPPYKFTAMVDETEETCLFPPLARSITTPTPTPPPAVATSTAPEVLSANQIEGAELLTTVRDVLDEETDAVAEETSSPGEPLGKGDTNMAMERDADDEEVKRLLGEAGKSKTKATPLAPTNDEEPEAAEAEDSDEHMEEPEAAEAEDSDKHTEEIERLSAELARLEAENAELREKADPRLLQRNEDRAAERKSKVDMGDLADKLGVRLEDSDKTSDLRAAAIRLQCQLKPAARDEGKESVRREEPHDPPPDAKDSKKPGFFDGLLGR